ncbi:MAG: DNA primase catalytic subunit PriS [Methanomicrobiaceae archaeon]|nr:DNA primase catalytic subunit PriS [Methanomicrobiaceae archaeon]
MDAATFEYMKKRFEEYYMTATFMMPPAVEQREWGFIFFDPSGEVRMKRHIGFSSKNEVETYMRSMVPRHAYHSTAYYKLPSASTMPEKVWLGADLIFDLDADHIMRGAYDVMLERVKEETYKLLDMLTGELGFIDRDVSIVFSGGRGYHIHVRNLETRQWGSTERRELVDYVCGIGIDPEFMLGKGRDSGWSARYRSAVSEYFDELMKTDRESAVKAVGSIRGVGDPSAGSFVDSLKETSRKVKSTKKDVPVTGTLKKVLEQDGGPLIDKIRERAALTDEPVTTDIKRLIRMPGSLHGGSGFRVVPLTVRDLDNFDPLVDAVVFGESPVRIDLAFSLTMPVLGNKYSLEKGINNVPEALAVFLCARGAARYAGSVR